MKKLLFIYLLLPFALWAQQKQLQVNLSQIRYKPGQYYFSLDQKQFLYLDRESSVKWDITTGRIIEETTVDRKKLDSIALQILSPNRQYIAEGRFDGSIVLRSFSTKKLIHTFKGHKRSIIALCFSPDDRYVASTSQDHSIRIWEVESGLLIRVFYGHTQSIPKVVFSPDNSRIVSGSRDHTTRIWDIKTGNLLFMHEFDTHVDDVAFANANNLVASVSFSYEDLRKEILIYNITTRRSIKILPKESYFKRADIEFSNDGKYLFIGIRTKILQFDTQTGKLINSFGDEKTSNIQDHRHIKTIQLHPNPEQLFISRYDQSTEVWDIASGTKVREIPDPKGEQKDFLITKDRQYIVTALDHQLYFIHTLTGKMIESSTSYYKRRSDLKTSPNQHYVAGSQATYSSRNGDGDTLCIWELATAKATAQIPTKCKSFSFSADSKELITLIPVPASGSNHYQLIFWEVNTGKKLRESSIFEADRHIKIRGVSSDNQWILIGGSNAKSIWKLSSAEKVGGLYAHKSFSFTGNVEETVKEEVRLKTGEKVILYDVTNLDYKMTKQQFVRDGYIETDSLAITYDNLGSDKRKFWLWSIAKHQLIKELELPITYQPSPLLLNNRFLKVSSFYPEVSPSSVFFIDIHTGKEVCTFYALQNGLSWFVLTPDGKYDGNEAGLRYLHYSDGEQVFPLNHTEDPNYVKGLLLQVLNDK